MLDKLFQRCINWRSEAVFTHHNRAQLWSLQVTESQSRGRRVCVNHDYAQVSVAHHFLLACFFFFNIGSEEIDETTNLMEAHGFRSGTSTTYTSFHSQVEIKWKYFLLRLFDWKETLRVSCSSKVGSDGGNYEMQLRWLSEFGVTLAGICCKFPFLCWKNS